MKSWLRNGEELWSMSKLVIIASSITIATVNARGEMMVKVESGSPTALVVMGVSGSGKTTVGRALAGRLGWHTQVE